MIWLICPPGPRARFSDNPSAPGSKSKLWLVAGALAASDKKCSSKIVNGLLFVVRHNDYLGGQMDYSAQLIVIHIIYWLGLFAERSFLIVKVS